MAHREVRTRGPQKKFMPFKAGKNGGLVIPRKFHGMPTRHIPDEIIVGGIRKLNELRGLRVPDLVTA